MFVAVLPVWPETSVSALSRSAEEETRGTSEDTGGGGGTQVTHGPGQGERVEERSALGDLGGSVQEPWGKI